MFGKAFRRKSGKVYKNRSFRGGRGEGGKEKRKKKTGFEMDPSINHTPRNRTRLIANPGVQRVNNDPGVSKISAKLARFERFDIVYSDDWRAACAISRLHGARVHCHAKPRHKSRIPDSIAIQRAMGMVTVRPVGTRNRIESNRCFQPRSSISANASIRPFLHPFFHPRSIRSIEILREQERERERYPRLHTPLALIHGIEGRKW